MKISPSVIAGDLADLTKSLDVMKSSGCDYVHFDVMDGHFVPNLTFGPPYIQHARQHTDLPFDVHLMVTNPADYVPQLANLGVDILSFHIEATIFAPRTIKLISDHGMRPFIAVNPQTTLSSIEHILPMVAGVLIMSVDPGFAGQSFIETVYAKIESLAEYRDENELVFLIEVDGGVNANNVDELSDIGVDLVVAGKAFFASEDQQEFVDRVHSLT